jgi:hypothetical protein
MSFKILRDLQMLERQAIREKFKDEIGKEKILPDYEYFKFFEKKTIRILRTDFLQEYEGKYYPAIEVMIEDDPLETHYIVLLRKPEREDP